MTSFWFHMTAETMAHKDLTKHVQDFTVKRYGTEQGYKRISKTLDTMEHPECHHQQVEKTTGTVPKHLNRQDEIYQGSVKSPTATLKELQEYLASTDHSLGVTISHILHRSGILVGWLG